MLKIVMFNVWKFRPNCKSIDYATSLTTTIYYHNNE